MSHFRRIYDRVSPTNQCWWQKTRVTAVLCGIKISTVHHLVLSQYTDLTDRRTDRQNSNSNTVHYITWCMVETYITLTGINQNTLFTDAVPQNSHKHAGFACKWTLQCNSQQDDQQSLSCKEFHSKDVNNCASQSIQPVTFCIIHYIMLVTLSSPVVSLSARVPECQKKWWVRPVWLWTLCSVTIWHHWAWKG